MGLFDAYWRILLKLQSVQCVRSVYYYNMPIDPSDYYLSTSRTGERPERWSWEIHRTSQPLGIKMTADGFQSISAAQFAGQKALADFLSDLAKEDKRLPKPKK